MKAYQFRTLSIILGLALWPFAEAPQRTAAACTAGQSPAALPYAVNGAPYDGYLDVAPCSATCGGTCYLSASSVLKWCQVTGSAESPEGCAPAFIQIAGYRGRCNPNPQSSYRCGCGDFDPQPSSCIAQTAQECSP